ncbi:GHKL domain-containing protein [Lactobacillus delbrueckii subsp. indicus]|uniref:ATP-binding protein n=1 Tax=Lactobacillus delbrueckii TaxID=1584 RepID=UPI002221C21A|nr:sensor histidine kinase [Lactobacillus delbrueckii]UYX12573.1 GHKL domain-containing protein [Lactobacillus delbrueckii]UYY84388.1 GHKL domain-containing protein [Lactobacillus delbrueckii subsp. indicus]
MDIKLPDIPRYYTALAETLACIMMIEQLPRKQIKSKRWLCYLAFFLGQMALQYLAGQFSLAFWLLGMLANLAWMGLMINTLEQTSNDIKLYHLSRAFITAEFMAALAWQVYCLGIQFVDQRYSKAFELMTMIVIYALIIAVLHYSPKTSPNNYSLLHISHKSALNSLLIMAMVFSVSNIGFLFSRGNFYAGNGFTIFTVRTFVDLCGLLLFSLQENQRYEHYLQRDLANINNMFNTQYEQYQAFRESNEIVNQRFHDLKHQLDIIALESSSDKRNEYIKHLQDDIKQFKADVKTGNPIVDVVLTRKNAYCIKHGITLTCIANGRLLDQIDTMDLCSLLGNSLDNAIEAVSKLDAPEKRLIDLRITQKGNLVVYNIRNYTGDPPKLENGSLPKSTKKDSSRPHGYGLRSIEQIAERYNATMNLTSKDNWFSLTVMFVR